MIILKVIFLFVILLVVNAISIIFLIALADNPNINRKTSNAITALSNIFNKQKH